ncbi:MAG: hypothetical protein M1829_006441 [Trizodia sp. TS-e1964]|nr:MAG: hypothetical protein M1829_006441 [Trizodia sp. TS-e1964]
MSRPYETPTPEHQLPINPNQAAGVRLPNVAGTSYKTNVHRQKTKRWVEAKSYAYDGDDWGEYDDLEDSDTAAAAEPLQTATSIAISEPDRLDLPKTTTPSSSHYETQSMKNAVEKSGQERGAVIDQVGEIQATTLKPEDSLPSLEPKSDPEPPTAPALKSSTTGASRPFLLTNRFSWEKDDQDNPGAKPHAPLSEVLAMLPTSIGDYELASPPIPSPDVSIPPAIPRTGENEGKAALSDLTAETEPPRSITIEENPPTNTGMGSPLESSSSSQQNTIIKDPILETTLSPHPVSTVEQSPLPHHREKANALPTTSILPSPENPVNPDTETTNISSPNGSFKYAHNLAMDESQAQSLEDREDLNQDHHKSADDSGTFIDNKSLAAVASPRELAISGVQGQTQSVAPLLKETIEHAETRETQRIVSASDEPHQEPFEHSSEGIDVAESKKIPGPHFAIDSEPVNLHGAIASALPDRASPPIALKDLMPVQLEPTAPSSLNRDIHDEKYPDDRLELAKGDERRFTPTSTAPPEIEGSQDGSSLGEVSKRHSEHGGIEGFSRSAPDEPGFSNMKDGRTETSYHHENPYELPPRNESSGNTEIQADPAPHPASPMKILSFREIMALKTPAERINGYNNTRLQFASMNTGLSHWMAATVPESVGQTALTDRPPAFSSELPNTPLYNSSGLLMPTSSDAYTTPDFTAPNPLLATGSSGLGAQPATNITMPTTPIAGQGLAKGKESQHSSGIFGAKGFFSKRRNKLRGGGDKSDNRSRASSQVSTNGLKVPGDQDTERFLATGSGVPSVAASSDVFPTNHEGEGGVAKVEINKDEGADIKNDDHEDNSATSPNLGSLHINDQIADQSNRHIGESIPALSEPSAEFFPESQAKSLQEEINQDDPLEIPSTIFEGLPHIRRNSTFDLEVVDDEIENPATASVEPQEYVEASGGISILQTTAAGLYDKTDASSSLMEDIPLSVVPAVTSPAYDDTGSHLAEPLEQGPANSIDKSDSRHNKLLEKTPSRDDFNEHETVFPYPEVEEPTHDGQSLHNHTASVEPQPAIPPSSSDLAHLHPSLPPTIENSTFVSHQPTLSSIGASQDGQPGFESNSFNNPNHSLSTSNRVSEDFGSRNTHTPIGARPLSFISQSSATNNMLATQETAAREQSLNAQYNPQPLPKPNARTQSVVPFQTYPQNPAPKHNLPLPPRYPPAFNQTQPLSQPHTTHPQGQKTTNSQAKPRRTSGFFKGFGSKSFRGQGPDDSQSDTKPMGPLGAPLSPLPEDRFSVATAASSEVGEGKDNSGSDRLRKPSQSESMASRSVESLTTHPSRSRANLLQQQQQQQDFPSGPPNKGATSQGSKDKRFLLKRPSSLSRSSIDKPPEPSTTIKKKRFSSLSGIFGRSSTSSGISRANTMPVNPEPKSHNQYQPDPRQSVLLIDHPALRGPNPAQSLPSKPSFQTHSAPLRDVWLPYEDDVVTTRGHTLPSQLAREVVPAFQTNHPSLRDFRPLALPPVRERNTPFRSSPPPPSQPRDSRHNFPSIPSSLREVTPSSPPELHQQREETVQFQPNPYPTTKPMTPPQSFDQISHAQPIPTSGFHSRRNEASAAIPPNHGPISFVGGRRLSEQQVAEANHLIESKRGFRGPLHTRSASLSNMTGPSGSVGASSQHLKTTPHQPKPLIEPQYETPAIPAAYQYVRGEGGLPLATYQFPPDMHHGVYPSDPSNGYAYYTQAPAHPPPKPSGPHVGISRSATNASTTSQQAPDTPASAAMPVSPDTAFPIAANEGRSRSMRSLSDRAARSPAKEQPGQQTPWTLSLPNEGLDEGPSDFGRDDLQENVSYMHNRGNNHMQDARLVARNQEHQMLVHSDPNVLPRRSSKGSARSDPPILPPKIPHSPRASLSESANTPAMTPGTFAFRRSKTFGGVGESSLTSNPFIGQYQRQTEQQSRSGIVGGSLGPSPPPSSSARSRGMANLRDPQSSLGEYSNTRATLPKPRSQQRFSAPLPLLESPQITPPHSPQLSPTPEPARVPNLLPITTGASSSPPSSAPPRSPLPQPPVSPNTLPKLSIPQRTATVNKTRVELADTETDVHMLRRRQQQQEKLLLEEFSVVPGALGSRGGVGKGDVLHEEDEAEEVSEEEKEEEEETEEEEAIVMTSTSYPGQEWAPSSYARWDVD